MLQNHGGGTRRRDGAGGGGRRSQHACACCAVDRRRPIARQDSFSVNGLASLPAPWDHAHIAHAPSLQWLFGQNHARMRLHVSWNELQVPMRVRRCEACRALPAATHSRGVLSDVFTAPYTRHAPCRGAEKCVRGFPGGGRVDLSCRVSPPHRSTQRSPGTCPSSAGERSRSA